MEISRPFIRLPFLFDAVRMAAEVEALDESAWMAHPSRMAGNAALPLVSRDAGDNDDFDGAMSPTRHLDKCEYIRQVMASFGEVLGRSRLMKLAPGAEVATHVDFNYHWYTRVRIHIPVITDPAVIFYCADKKVHMRPGESWIFNSWRRHRVVNESSIQRVHLVIDTAGSSRFWEMVRQMGKFDPVADRSRIEERLQSVVYVPGKEVELLTEKYNIAPVMSPGELDALVSALVGDFEKNPENDPGLVAAYKLMLYEFTKDWREVWHLHGYQKEGWPKYQKLIDTVTQKLHPNRRALVTSTNQVGVNPIIVQRILRSALAVDKYDQFIGGADSPPP